MDKSDISFRELIHPLAPEDFLAENFGRAPVRISGSEGKFADVFSWDEANRLLNISKIWSSGTLRLLFNGQVVPSSEYCYESRNRDGNQILRPDPTLVTEAMRAGSILVLDEIETLSPAVAAIAAALQLALDGVVTCTALCAWQRQAAGAPPCFDVGEGFAVQVSGSSRWRFYEGRFQLPDSQPQFSYAGFSEDYHRQTASGVAAELESAPGDLLYIPSGQYYSETPAGFPSLYLWFELRRPTGNEFCDFLFEALTDEGSFREPLPHYDAVGEDSDYFKRAAADLRRFFSANDVGARMRARQKQRVTRRCFSRFTLPRRDGAELYRVRWRGAQLVRRGPDWRLQLPDGGSIVTAEEAPMVEWLLDRDAFTAERLRDAFASVPAEALDAALRKFGEMALIERL
ncbi:MAG: cupin domain-containing protein [Alphaproteobacteria bacterium]|nr:cupin domain-containing protein [Alphaproteobacteria bacterium]